MYKNIWEFCHRSVCSICFYTESGIKITTLSGFRIEDFIVTDEQIYKVKSCYQVIIQFFESNGHSVSNYVKLSFDDLKSRVHRHVEYENEGYALIETDDLMLNDIPALIPECQGENRVGMSVAIIGFHEEQSNMSLKIGNISSFLRMENGKRYIQFEANVKQGNSGSPLINIETGKVIGVVGYRLSAFVSDYEAFKNIIDENLKILKKSEGKMNIMDIDPIQVLIANQNQLKQMSREFYKSAVMSYGFANEVFTLKNYIAQKSIKVSTEI